MQHKLATLALIGLSAFTLSACSSAPAKSAAAPMEPAKPALSEAAQQALAQAEADVKAAKAKFALWTTAESALKSAQEAAKEGNSDAVIKNAKFASSQSALGLGQLSYPSTEPK
jgi:hypothetical protein